ncbi:MAG: hypothetical protein J6V36_00510, partial [Clostridia bacterium]|nr:hypothetical protein [Clostridia bacterium]
ILRNLSVMHFPGGKKANVAIGWIMQNTIRKNGEGAFNKNVDFSETNGTEDIKKIEEKEEVKEAESVKIIAEEKETKETRETKEIREISKKREESETREIAQNIALSEGGMAEDALKDGMKYLVFSVVGVLLTLWILFKNI